MCVEACSVKGKFVYACAHVCMMKRECPCVCVHMLLVGSTCMCAHTCNGIGRHTCMWVSTDVLIMGQECVYVCVDALAMGSEYIFICSAGMYGMLEQAVCMRLVCLVRSSHTRCTMGLQCMWDMCSCMQCAGSHASIWYVCMYVCSGCGGNSSG